MKKIEVEVKEGKIATIVGIGTILVGILLILVYIRYPANSISIEIVGCLVAAIIIFAVTAFAGGLISWISTIFLYGFGQLVENSDKLVKLNQTKKADQNLEI